MRKKIAILLALVLFTASCRKDESVFENVPQASEDTLTKEQVQNWLETSDPGTRQQSVASSGKHFQLSPGILDPAKLESMPNASGNYLLQLLPGQPTFQGRSQGYRKIAFIKDSKGQIQARILEIIPDARYLQRKQRVTTSDFSGRIFLFSGSYQLLGGTVVSGGKKIGEIAPSNTSLKTNTVQLTPSPIVETCVWEQSNYVDADGVAVVYAEKICSYSTPGNGFGDISGGYDAGGGNYAAPGYGGGGGGSAPGSTPAEMSNLPGESGGAVDPKAYMSCFSNIPDAGATMKVTVYVQEPQPGTNFNIGKNSVGHVAIGLSKSNGSQSVNQVLGFYPNATGFDKMHAPSKIVDNGGTLDFNMSISFSVSAQQLNQIMNYIADPPKDYDLLNFNCTGFVYSACQSGGIVLPNPYSTIGPAGQPGGIMNSMTPAGLGNSIENMKGQNNVNTTGGTSPFSKGPCN